MIDNPTYAAAEAALHAQFKAGTINQTQLADGLEVLLNQARLDLSTSGLAKAVVDALALFNAKWSVWDDITGRGSVALVADLPVDGADGDCYWVNEAALPLYPDGQFWVWFNGLWVAQGDKVTQGRTGTPGSTPNITTGVVTTGAPGSPVTVTITGTSPNLVMNVSIPAGADGPASAWGLIPGDLADQADLQAALNAKQAALGFTPENAASKGAANGYAPLGADSRIDSAYIPAVAITDTWEVASQAAMLALTAQRGDVAIRTDENKSYVLSSDSPSTLADWKHLRTPTDAVLSVAGKTGAVTLVKGDVGLSAVDNTADADKPISTAAQAALDAKQAADADLAAIAALAPANGQVLRFVGGAWAAQYPTESLIIAVGDETTDITTGTAKVSFRMPYAFKLTAVKASLNVAGSGPSVFDINEGDGPTSILSTKLSIDATEKTSATAATPPVISDADLADDALITIDIDTAGVGAQGAKIALIGYRTA